MKDDSTKKLRLGTVAPIPVEARRNATRFIASQALDAGDCTELLAMLGLTPQEGK